MSVDDVRSSVGSKLYISTAMPATEDSAGYGALSYTEIKYISNIGEFGGSREVLKFNLLSEDVVLKRVGVADYGTLAVEAAKVSSDPGQILCVAAFNSKNVHSFKVTSQDGTVFYFKAVVSSDPTKIGGTGDFTTTTFNIEITSKPIEVTGVAHYTVTFSAGANGSIIGDDMSSGSSVQVVATGGSCTPVYANAATGYNFDEWNDGNTDNPRTITNVTANATYTAAFVAE